jgi:hypothetical protein
MSIICYSQNTRVKVRLSPLHDMKTYGGMKVQLHSFLTSALEGGEFQMLSLIK